MKAQPTPVTEFAREALTGIFQSSYVVLMLHGSVQGDEARLQQQNLLTGLNNTNQKFNDASEFFLGRALFCQAVDAYNWYCQEVLKLAIFHNPQSIPPALAGVSNDLDRVFQTAREKGVAAADALLQRLEKPLVDSAVRKALHRHLNLHQESETELLCLCRNILVHRQGVDHKGEIPAGLKALGSKRALVGAPSFPSIPLPVAVEANGSLKVNSLVGRWVADFMKNQIFGMDQEISHRYSIPRAPMPQLSISQKIAG